MHGRASGHLTPALVSCAVFLLALLLPFALGACHGESVEWSTPEKDHVPLNGDYFVHENGRCTYERDQITARKTGVDVSDYQGNIDWDAVANDGVEFAMIRVGYRGSTKGGLFKDEFFEQNLHAAQKAGIECGVYFYSQAINEDEANEEAAFVIDVLGSQKLEYPVSFDYEPENEGRIATVNKATATACAQTFCKTIQDAGYTPMLYGNSHDLQRIDLTALADYPIWFAEYDASPSNLDSSVMWQYSCTGQVAGIDTPVDLDLDLRDAL